MRRRWTGAPLSKLPQYLKLEHTLDEVPKPILVLIGLGGTLLDLGTTVILDGDEHLLAHQLSPDEPEKFCSVIGGDELDPRTDLGNGVCTVNILCDDGGLECEREPCTRDANVYDTGVDRNQW